jgi:GAF domain-containing protein
VTAEPEPEAQSSAEPGLSVRILVWAAEVVATVSADRLSEHCSVFIADDSLALLILAGARWGTGEDTGMVVPGKWVVPFDGSVCGSVYLTGRPALIQDVAQDESYRTYPGARARSELTVPITSGGRRIGVLNLESSRTGTFGIADLEVLVAHAGWAGATFATEGLAADLAGEAP